MQIDPSDAVKAGVSSGGGGRVTLTPADCDAILRECGTVRWAAPGLDIRTQLVYGNRNWSPDKLLGTTPDYLVVRNWRTWRKESRSPTATCAAPPACAWSARRSLGNFSAALRPVGKEIRVKNMLLKVLGVLSAKGANMMGRDQDDFVIVPWTTLKFRLSGSRQPAAVTADTSTAGTVNTLNQLYPSQQVQLYPQPSAAQAADTVLDRRGSPTSTTSSCR